MTYRELLELMQGFLREYPDHEALDRRVVVRVRIDDDLHVGGLDSASVDAGCTEKLMLVLDASDDPDDPDDPDLDDLDDDQGAQAQDADAEPSR